MTICHETAVDQINLETMLPAAGQKLPFKSNMAWRLFLLGFLTLFLELILIRYLAASIWNLGYFPNIVLLTAFVGMGLGFVFHHHIREQYSVSVFQAAMLLIAALFVFVFFKHPIVPGFSLWNYNLDGDLYFSFTQHAKVDDLNYYFFIFCFVLVALIFAMISQRTAKLFSQFRPLDAYTLDILGSCVGIVVFMGLSALRMPAWSWMLLFTLVFPFAMPKKRLARLFMVLIGCISVLVMFRGDAVFMTQPEFAGRREVTWSPYQKIEFIEDQVRADVPPRLRIYANGLDHQEMVPNVERLFYQTPHKFRASKNLPAYQNVLVIGAGSGNDVAAALLNGATHVDAVEIDPVISAIGSRHNPYGAYSDPRVTVHVDDGRSFMTNTTQKYDLIIFALTDSLVKISSLSQLRLENYLFTRESLQRAYQLLNPNGNIVFYNFYRLPFVVDKIHALLGEATGTEPQLLAREADFVMLLGEKPTLPVVRTFETDPRVAIPSDDWPFLYLERHGIPSMYIVAMSIVGSLILLLLGMLHVTTRKFAGNNKRGSLAIKFAFVVMGIAFMLLEAKSVIQFSLLFGTTWINNSLIFLAVLLSVLAANWTVQLLSDKWFKHQWLLFGLLICSCLATLAYPLGNLLEVQNPLLRFIAASLFTFLPIYLANLVFSRLFRDLEIAEHVYGWNLLGATLGGVAEYFGMVLGYGALAVIVALLYSLVFMLLQLATLQAADSTSAIPD